jgi:hypothetical protein
MFARKDTVTRPTAQGELRRKLGGGLLGYAFVASVAFHLVLWGILAMPRDDAGPAAEAVARAARTPAPAELVNRLWRGEAADADSRLATASPESHNAPDGYISAWRADEGRASAYKIGDPLDNTPNRSRRVAERLTPARAGPDGVDNARAPASPEETAVYIDGGGKVRGAAVAASAGTVALENEAMMAALRRAYKAAQEDAKPAAARVAITPSPLSRQAPGSAYLLFWVRNDFQP